MEKWCLNNSALNSISRKLKSLMKAYIVKKPRFLRDIEPEALKAKDADPQTSGCRACGYQV